MPQALGLTNQVTTFQLAVGRAVRGIQSNGHNHVRIQLKYSTVLLLFLITFGVFMWFWVQVWFWVQNASR